MLNGVAPQIDLPETVAHRGRIAALANGLAQPLAYDRDAISTHAARLGAMLRQFSADEPVATRVAADVAALMTTASRIAPDAGAAVRGYAETWCMPQILGNVAHADRPAALDLLTAALLWPAVYGANPNPFAEVVALARLGVSVTTVDQGLLVHHNQLVMPVAWPAPAPPPPPRLTIVRDLG